ncbi:MAG: sodium:calcium antiporter [Anaerolineae bacterium]
MVFLEFAASAAIVALASIQLSRYGDIIAFRTGLGGVFVGAVLMAAVTSLPELLVLSSAFSAGLPNLAIGGLLGSSMFNILILAILDLIHHKQRILRKAAMRHALTGSLAVLMITLALFFIYADLPYNITLGSFSVGYDSLTLMVTFVVGMRLVQGQSRSLAPAADDQCVELGLPSLRASVLRFGLAAGVLVLLTPRLVATSGEIATVTGLGATFVGATLLAIVTSVPELVTTISAARIGADDMAIGNLFGSNMFNMFLLGAADLLLPRATLFSVVDDSFLLVGSLGLIMTVLGLVGNLARIERRLLIIEIDALLLILVYFGGMALLYTRGLTP